MCLRAVSSGAVSGCCLRLCNRALRKQVKPQICTYVQKCILKIFFIYVHTYTITWIHTYQSIPSKYVCKPSIIAHLIPHICLRELLCMLQKTWPHVCGLKDYKIIFPFKLLIFDLDIKFHSFLTVVYVRQIILNIRLRK